MDPKDPNRYDIGDLIFLIGKQAVEIEMLRSQLQALVVTRTVSAGEGSPPPVDHPSPEVESVP